MISIKLDIRESEFLKEKFNYKNKQLFSFEEMVIYDKILIAEKQKKNSTKKALKEIYLSIKSNPKSNIILLNFIDSIIGEKAIDISKLAELSKKDYQNVIVLMNATRTNEVFWLKRSIKKWQKNLKQL